MQPIVVINAVGLTPRLLPHAPLLQAIADSGWQASMPEVLPAVTCTAQATLLTGLLPEKHGIVANGWLFRGTNEVRFWQQSNRLIQGDPIYATARLRAKAKGIPFRSAKLFWWFNQGAAVDISITPKPYYGIDGNKVFGITGTPNELPQSIENRLGRFPFPSFWGPMAGKACTEWIASAAALVLREQQPSLTLVYLPHLDYDPQRFGPSRCHMPSLVKELDQACLPLLDSAKAIGAKVWVVSEYGHCDVDQPVLPNRILRRADLLEVRRGPFGEQLDLFSSRAFAVCDHQLAHIYVQNPDDVPIVAEHFTGKDGIAQVLMREERAQIRLTHDRAGEIILVAEPNSWFAYPFWIDESVAPDYARSVAIHHKPGFDPCELFFDPSLWFPKFHAARKLMQKKLGFRMRMDITPLDPTIVSGSHGLPAADPLDRPILIGHGRFPGFEVPMTEVHDLLLESLNLV